MILLVDWLFYSGLGVVSLFGDPYKILGVNPNMSIDEIKKSYRRLAKLYHPDSPNGNQEEFIKIQKAWEAIESNKAICNKVKKSFMTHISLFKFRRI